MSRSNHSHRRKKRSKVTTKTHRKKKPHSKVDWQKLFRERYFV